MAMEQPLTDLASKRGGGLLLRGLLVVSLIIVATLFAAELLLPRHRCQRTDPLGARGGFPVRSGTRLGPHAKRRHATNERQSYDFSETQRSRTARARAGRHCAGSIPLSWRLVHLWLRRRGGRTVQRSSAESVAAIWNGQCRRFRLRNRSTISTDEAALEGGQSEVRGLDLLRRQRSRRQYQQLSLPEVSQAVFRSYAQWRMAGSRLSPAATDPR